MISEWEDAPEWAKYIVKDKDGKWIWYENKPKYDPTSDQWVERIIGRKMYAKEIYNGWRESLEEKPKYVHGEKRTFGDYWNR